MFNNPFNSAIGALTGGLGIGRVRQSFGRWAAAAVDLALGRKFSHKEGRLAADAYAVKRKLGNSFFTRKLSKATRRKRIARLSLIEKVIASEQGWLLLTHSEYRRAVERKLIRLAA